MSSKNRPSLKRTKQLELYRRATKVLPGGANSNFRAWGEDTIYVDRGEGSHVWDMDGNEFIDLRMGYGPVILGHGDPRVDDHVNERMRKGVSFSLTSEDELKTAELIVELTKWPAQARMTVSGTEATMHAMRLARGFTGRSKIVKFEGGYHGVHDYALVSVTPNAEQVKEFGDLDNPVALTWGRGVPEAITKTMIPARYNALDVLRRIFEREGDEIAAVIVEPVLGNAQAILPKPGFHKSMRALTQEFGALLIFDEVKTGFRLAKGGAAEFFGVTPDIATYAKAMGNGYPAAAFAATAPIMAMLPDKVSHGGTYAGNRVAASAAAKTLQILRDTDALETVKQTGERVQREIRTIVEKRGLPVSFTGHPTMYGIVFSETAPTEYREWAEEDRDLYDAVALGMHRYGAMPEPDSREPWFFCEAHSKGDDVDRILGAFESALDDALEDRAAGHLETAGSAQYVMSESN